MTPPLHAFVDMEQLRSLTLSRVEAIADLATSIAEVSAPTGFEHERAALVASFLDRRGYAPETDEVGNVYVRRPGTVSGLALMLVAHTDTVFPMETDVQVRREGDVLHGPGVGDNSLGVAAMISCLEILDELKPQSVPDIIAVASVGEEGLGNLRGVRTAVDRFQDEIGALIAVEGHNLGRVTHAAVGSVRWRISVTGPGGHSWGAFGKPSAIHGLGRIISQIAELDVPPSPKTTFNVGTIGGGTSVNTIAPLASALVDMRSVDKAALDALVDRVGHIAAQAAGAGLETNVEVLGERPAGSIALDHPFVQLAGDVLRELGFEPVFDASSTDANISISLGIPSICVGISRGGLGHTINEHIEVPPIELGVSQLVALSIASHTTMTESHVRPV